MTKTVIIINGRGGVGKDTLCEYVSKTHRVRNVSTITPIKDIARQFGWKGEKTDRDRKFLSDLKMAFAAYNDLPTEYLAEEYRKFMESDDEILFAHIREGAEIEKFKKRVANCGRTCLAAGSSPDEDAAGRAQPDKGCAPGQYEGRDLYNEKDGARVVTLLVRRAQVTAAFGNTSDDEVENYDYDYYYLNCKPLEQAGPDFVAFLENVILQEVRYAGIGA
ncbi:MAG: AAA family ATPase [Lachnospiraceae bacterium]|nr:AAA family ATPase [Lachnospiraceae bacterium]